MYKNCYECQEQFLYTTCSSQVCVLVDAKIRASDKDLPVLGRKCQRRGLGGQKKAKILST